MGILKLQLKWRVQTKTKLPWLTLPKSKLTETKNCPTELSSMFLSHSDMTTEMNMSPNLRSWIQPSTTKHTSTTQILNSINLPQFTFTPTGWSTKAKRALVSNQPHTKTLRRTLTET